MATLTRPFRGTRSLAAALSLGGLGALGWGLGMTWPALRERALFSYLTAFSFAASVGLGGLFLLLIGLAAGARWMTAVRRAAESVALAMVPLAALFAPIALDLPRLYLWAAPETVELSLQTRELLAHKRAYLNAPFFVIRTAVYFVVWIAAATVLSRRSRQRDRQPPATEGSEAVPRTDERFASAMLVPTAIATTFASFDWLMSLEPTWYSSAFGAYFFAGGFVAAIALVTFMACVAVRRGGYGGTITVQHLHALGRLLFAFSVFWAYIAYFQIFLIAIADKPFEVAFYASRLRGGSRTVANALLFGQFALPTLLLLPKSVKFKPAYLGAVSLLVFCAHYLDVAWLVLPALMPAGLSFHWLDLAALCGVGGLCTAACLIMQRGALPIAEGDPSLKAAARYAGSS